MNIKHLNKAAVLAALYNNSKPQGMGMLHFEPSAMTEQQAQQFLDDGQTYFDYLKGRVLKIDLSTDELDTYLYNRDLGQGAAERVIERLTSEQQPSL